MYTNSDFKYMCQNYTFENAYGLQVQRCRHYKFTYSEQIINSVSLLRVVVSEMFTTYKFNDKF